MLKLSVVTMEQDSDGVVKPSYIGGPFLKLTMATTITDVSHYI